VFGPVLLFGRGGTAVELSKEHALALPPLNEVLARDLIAGSGLSPLLAGYRGQPPVHEQHLVDALVNVSRMAAELAPLAELDINPLLADSRGVLALDARIKVRLAGQGTAPPPAIRPYPAALEETVRLGPAQLLVRPIRPEDGQRLKDFYAKASPSDMRLRFFMARREVPHSELARYSQIDYEREMTFIALAPPDESGARRMVGEVRAVCDPDNVRAEFAIQIASDWQAKGLGRMLMDKLVRYLRARGTGEIVGQCLVENTAMAALARAAGFEVSPDPVPGTMAMRLQLAASRR
jgi:acetyltransferase